MLRKCLAILAVLIVLTLAPLQLFGADMFVFFGTHNSGPTRGFCRSTFDSATGVLSKPEFVLAALAPAYFVLSADGKHLYSCNSGTPVQGTGGVSAYDLNPKTGDLKLLNTVPAGGADTSFITLDRGERHALVANYDGGNIAVFAIKPDFSIGDRTAFVQHTGSSINPTRQTHAYAHSIRLDPSGKFVLVADLGLDKVFVYKYDNDKGTLTPNDPPSVSITPGEGARHFYFHPQHPDWMYLITEMGCTIHYFHWDSDRGVLAEKQKISTLPPDFKGTSTCAEILVHPGGKFLYCSNRGDDSIGEFAIDPQSGKLTLIGHVKSGGKTPRNFEIDPTGHWLLTANQDGNNACVFAIDLDTGKLTQKGDAVAITYPFCPRFLPISAK